MLDIFEIQIPINAAVHAVDGVCGHGVGVIIDPIKEMVTHLVVQENDSPRFQRLVPIDFVHGTLNKEIEIKCGTKEFKAMEAFVEMEFLPSDSQSALSRFWPHGEPDSPLTVPKQQKIPAGEVVIGRGVPVHAADGVIGQVDELMLDRRNGSITHLVLREGHLWGQKDISIPVSEMKSMDKDAVYLKLTKRDVQELPEIPIHRFQR